MKTNKPLLLLTFGFMLALLWLGLLTVPQLVFSFYTLPVGAAVFVVFAVLFRLERLPVEISVPAMGGALALVLLGWLVYFAAAGPDLATIGGPLLLGLLIYLIFTRR